MRDVFKKFGPGFLFAGAAIGVSHLVQSTRAGADFGFGLVWALLLINFIKYPFFQFGPRYAAATGENLLQGFQKIGKWLLILYFIITLTTMFTIQTAVTIVTAGIASALFGGGSMVFWTSVILMSCVSVLILGKYQLLDNLMKYIIILLTISTIIAIILAYKNYEETILLEQIFPTETLGIAFLVAFMGWMPAPLDITIWQSIWTIEKQRITPKTTSKESLFDFNVGYIVTIFLGLCFISLGALVMYNSGETFSENGTEFANQLIGIYTKSLGDWAKIIIGIAALTTMLSTTITTLDASPRVMQKTTSLLFQKEYKRGYFVWLLFLVIGTLCIFFFFISEMGTLIKIATILSFLTAPFYAIITFVLVNSKWMPENKKPNKLLNLYALIGIIGLLGFSFWYTLFL